jgi:hypothetical protein
LERRQAGLLLLLLGLQWLMRPLCQLLMPSQLLQQMARLFCRQQLVLLLLLLLKQLQHRQSTQQTASLS